MKAFKVYAASIKLFSSNMTHACRPWQIYFSLMYVQVLPFYNICLLTYYGIKIFVPVHKAENVLHAFLKAQCFLDQPQYAFGFRNFSLIIVVFVISWNSRIYLKVCTQAFFWLILINFGCINFRKISHGRKPFW